MPVPKRKTSKARRDKRSANKHIRPQAVTSCDNCQHPLATHTACGECGYYKGRKVMKTKFDRMIKRHEASDARQATAKPEHEHPEEK
jgi:large subunit ribosomal protein L32